MSSIGAIFSVEGVSPDEVQTMASSLGQVPHDEIAQWQAGPMALVSATLHTTAASRTGKQPLTTEDGRLATVFDGYLLNSAELAEDLRAAGAKLVGSSDVELALAAYEAWGDGFAQRLEGEFSLIIADQRRGRMLIARDHLGFVPLFYIEEPGWLVVASDFRTLGALSRSQFEPDRHYLAQLITNRWFLEEATAWRGVKRAKRAHVTVFDGQRVSSSRYWEPPTDITIRYKDDREYAEHYREMLLDCVRRASISDRPVGVAVSGGLDSSSLFCLADILERRGELGAPGFAGYSLAAADGSNAFELPYARAAAKHIGRELTEVPLFDPDIEWYSQDAAWHNDIPIASNGAMMLGLDERVVADGSRVLINGNGGDEWLQGNSQYYREFVAERDLRRFVDALRHDATDLGWSSAMRIAGRQAAAEITPAPLRSIAQRLLRSYRRKTDRMPAWLRADLRDVLQDAEEAYTLKLPENGVVWAKHNLVKSPFSDLTYTLMRRQRAKIGLESRHPMLSRRFIEFSLQTPGHIKRRGSRSKIVHRQAMADILPQAILDRTTKANFTNTKIDMQFADYVRKHAHETLGEICDFDGLEKVLSVDFSSPEGDLWAWEIWGLYASAAFLYRC